MIATFAIEIALALYTVIRYKMTHVTRLIGAALVLLALFQFAEYNVCENIWGHANVFSRVGFIAITMLPPVGIHLVRAISKRSSDWLVGAAYATGLSFALVFGLSDSAFNNHVCTGNYVIFHLAPNLGGLYFAYYYFWLVLGVLLCLYYSITSSQKVRQALIFQAIGYLSFVLPTAIANTLNPTSIQGLPSVMCGFAVIYALLLAFGIAPALLTRKK
jgi:hypothetical protein